MQSILKELKEEVEKDIELGKKYYYILEKQIADNWTDTYIYDRQRVLDELNLKYGINYLADVIGFSKITELELKRRGIRNGKSVIVNY